MTLAELLSRQGRLFGVPSNGPTPTPRVFWSASDFPGDFQALLEAKVPLGVAVKRMTKENFNALVAALRATKNLSTVPMFVDSGAYSESGKRFTEADWVLVMERYARLAVGGSRMYFVAPDEVGSFEGTERRLANTAPQLRALLRTGAHLLLPIQPGPGSLGEREARLLSAAKLSRDGAQVHPALPWTTKVPHPSASQVSAWLRVRRPILLHFLGAGDRNPEWPELVEWVRTASPSTQVQGDSNRWGAMRQEGRPLTRAGELVDMDLLELEPFDEIDADITDAEGEVLGDEEEKLFTLLAWTSPKERSRIAQEAHLDDSLVALFVSGPVEHFIDARSALEEETGAGDYLHEALDMAWGRRAERFAPDRRRHLANRHVLRTPPSAESLLRWVETDSGRPLTDLDIIRWLKDARVRMRGAELVVVGHTPDPETARRRLHDALILDAQVGALHALRSKPVRVSPTLAELLKMSR